MMTTDILRFSPKGLGQGMQPTNSVHKRQELHSNSLSMTLVLASSERHPTSPHFDLGYIEEYYKRPGRKIQKIPS